MCFTAMVKERQGYGESLASKSE